MSNESAGQTAEQYDTEEADTRKLAEARWRYFAEIVTAVRVGSELLSEKEHKELIGRRRHNANMRARTAARVAIGARMPIVVKPR